MALKLKRLKALDVERTELKAGMHADGGGLYLRVAPGGSRQWIFRYKRAGKLIDLGQGGVTSIGLADARGNAADYRKQ